MLIRFGYDITVTCAEPTAMLCFLTVHDERAADIRSAETAITSPDVATTTYRDVFGNVGRRFVAPAGDFSIWGDGTIEDDGALDPVDWSAVEIPVADLPDDCLMYLMGSRYCETDKLSQIAWGTVCFVGEGGDVTLDVSRDMLRKQLTLVGSWTFSAMGMGECARFVADNRIPLEKIFTHRWKLDQAPEGKGVIEF